MTLAESINERLLRETTLKLAWTNVSNLGLIPPCCPVFRVGQKRALFGYDTPPSGLAITAVSKSQLSESHESAETVTPDPVESGACEIAEVSPKQWEVLKQLLHGERVDKNSPDISYLVSIGLVDQTDGGNLKLSKMAKEWVTMDR